MADGLDIIIITGLSGSGKSFAIRALEDNGFFCVDNLPALLIPKFVDLCQGYEEEIRRIALGVDLRGVQFLSALPQVLSELRAAGNHIQILFFDASDDVLLRRFSETRRPHPLAGQGSIQDGISRERKALESIRALADKVIDTSEFNVHQLKREMEQQFCQAPTARRMALFFTSFGYKFGIPHDTDMILDVRFLPNPYFISELREKSGLDSEVKEYARRRRNPCLPRSFVRASRIHPAALRARGKEQPHASPRLHGRQTSFSRIGGGVSQKIRRRQFPRPF